MPIENKDIKEFKDKWSKDKGYSDWNDYKNSCVDKGTEIEYDQLMLDLANSVLDALRPRMKNVSIIPKCPNHPNANTYFSQTGNICCIECFEVIK